MNERHATFPSAPEAFFLVLCFWAISYLMSIALYDARHWLGIDDGFSLGTIAMVLANGIIFSALMEWKKLSYKDLFNSSHATTATTVAVLVPLVILATPLLLLVMGQVDNLLQAQFPMNASVKEQFRQMNEIRLPQIVAICVLAPVLEEMLFRGIILRSFLQQYDRDYAILGSAVVFGFAHGNIYQLVDAAVFGVFAGWLYERTRSLIPGIALHAAANTGSTLWAAYASPSSSAADSSTWAVVTLAALPACFVMRRLLTAPAQ